jgi:hypothetical protein
MAQIMIGDAFSRQLNGLSAPVDLCYGSGRVLGQFVPAVKRIDVKQLQADGCPYSEEELYRMRRETGGRSLPEIWRDLGQA